MADYNINIDWSTCDSCGGHNGYHHYWCTYNTPQYINTTKVIMEPELNEHEREALKAAAKHAEEVFKHQEHRVAEYEEYLADVKKERDRARVKYESLKKYLHG